LISETRDSFWILYRSLPSDARRAAREAYARFATNPAHPGLRFHRLNGFPNAWSVRISDSYRAMGIAKGGTISWIWIGTHAAFNRQFGE
jgi:hypothetical protein